MPRTRRGGHPARIPCVIEELRKAASVIAVREDPGGPQVLVVERSARNRFLPGYVVFPGGAVDADDADLARTWFGDPVEAARTAAVRELAEEVGLVLTRAGLRPVGDGDPLAQAVASPPGADQLHESAHWIAPEDVPVRFDARYFTVFAPNGLDPVPDGTEAAHAWWVTPARLLAEWESGDRKLYWPTLLTMQALARCVTGRELLAFTFETREPSDDEVDRLPRSVFWQD